MSKKIYSRTDEFRKKGLGLFIHWGLFSLLDRGEWVWTMYKMKKEKYLKLLDRIDELDIDFDEIMRNAKSQGFRYAVFTTRHHDGFSLYDTHGLTKYDINLRKDKRDFVREFIEACHKYGISPHLYHTTLDWSNPDFENDFDSYLTYLNRSIETLCRDYHDIGGFWFDGNWSKKDANWKDEKMYQIIRKYHPNAIIANNTGMSNRGVLTNNELDVLTYEQGKLDSKECESQSKAVKEVCRTFNDHWGCASNDYNHKSFPEILYSFLKCRHYNANLLLNVGPNYQGLIPTIDIAVLNLLGKWIEKFGFMLYDGEIISLLKNGKENINHDFIAKYETKYYLFLYNIESGGHVNAIQYGGKKMAKRTYDSISIPIKTIKSIVDNTEIDFSQKNEEFCITPFAFDYGYNTIVHIYQINLKE